MRAMADDCCRGGVLLQAAIVSAAAWIAGGDNRDVTEFAGHPNMSVQHFAVGDDAAADTGAECQQNQIMYIPPGADPFLSQSGSVGIIFEEYRRPSFCSMSSRIGKLSNSGRLLEPTITPFSIRINPGTPIPTPARISVPHFCL